MQLNGTPGHDYKNFGDLCKQIMEREGPKGFFKGLWATYLKVAPMTAILFLTNESLKRQLGIWKLKKHIKKFDDELVNNLKILFK